MTSLSHAVRDIALVGASRLSPRPALGGESVLIVQPDHLGDILLSQPAVTMLRRNHPDTRLIGVVGPWSEAITRIAWPVDDIVTIPFPGFARANADDPTAPYRLLQPAAATLRRLDPAVAIVMRPDGWWSAWLASLVAHDVVTSDDHRCRRFATRIVAVSEREHAAIRSARIAAGWGGGDVPTPEDTPLSINRNDHARDEAAALLHSSGVYGRYAVIHPGSGAAVKLWPGSRWSQVASALLERGLAVVITGSDQERAICADVVANRDVINLAGQTTIDRLLEILRGATVVVGTDNGPLHLAVAAGAPTIQLFGPSDPGRYGPWGNPGKHRVVTAGWRCPRCGDLGPDRPAGCGCMLAITPECVIAAVDSLLEDDERG